MVKHISAKLAIYRAKYWSVLEPRKRLFLPVWQVSHQRNLSNLARDTQHSRYLANEPNFFFIRLKSSWTGSCMWSLWNWSKTWREKSKLMWFTLSWLFAMFCQHAPVLSLWVCDWVASQIDFRPALCGEILISIKQCSRHRNYSRYSPDEYCTFTSSTCTANHLHSNKLTLGSSSTT